MSTLKAGAAYFACVFAIGFALGTVRVVFLETALGDLVAVLIELPVMLAASWVICAWLIRKFGVSALFAPRATMGLTAFALLIGAEFILAFYGFQRSPVEQMGRYLTAAGAIGLAGQALFALFPVIQAGRAR